MEPDPEILDMTLRLEGHDDATLEFAHDCLRLYRTEALGAAKEPDAPRLIAEARGRLKERLAKLLGWAEQRGA